MKSILPFCSRFGKFQSRADLVKEFCSVACLLAFLAVILEFASATVAAGPDAATFVQDTADSLKQSAAKLEEEVLAFNKAGDSTAEAQGLMRLGNVYQRLGENRRALESYRKALALHKAAGNKIAEAATLTAMGITLGRMSDYQQSIVSYQQALPIYQAEGNRKAAAVALAGIGFAYRNLNEYDKAIDALNESLQISRQINDPGSEALALYYTGLVNFSRDEYAKAIEFYERSRVLARTANDASREGSILQAMGQAHYRLRNYQHALDLYGQALAFYRSTQNRSGEASTLGTMGQVYRALGDYQRALELFSQTAVVLRATGERLNEATSLNNSGHVYLALNQAEDARRVFEQSLEICKAIKNRAGEASNTNGLGLAHSALTDYQKALGLHLQALEIFRAIGGRRGEADTLGHIGRTYSSLGDTEKAVNNLSNALSIYRFIKAPREESQTLYSIARAYKLAGKLNLAKEQIEAAIRLTELLRRDVASQQLRASYLASVRDFYELNVDVLMQLHKVEPAAGHAIAALEVSERARARTFLDLLAESAADIRQGVDPDLLEKERRLRQQVSARAERQTLLLSGRSTPVQIDSASRELEASLAEYDEVQAKIKTSNVRYAALMNPEPLKPAQIQNDLLEDDTLVLEYFLARQRSYLWAISKTSVIGYELPGEAEIEVLARRFHDLSKPTPNNLELEMVARQLSDVLLLPALQQLNKKRLVVIADGALHYIPFAALQKPGTAPTSEYEPLIVRHEVVSLPSASILALLRSETKKRARAPNLVAVIADPVFGENDVRLKRLQSNKDKNTTTSNNSDLVRSIGDTGFAPGTWPLPRLLGTRREARSILSFVPAQESMQALDFDANRETVNDEKFGSYQIVHFATHAFVNNQHPELSGLVLSLVDQDGKPRDGFLRLNDIYNLRLPAELVVLSACRTGLGKEIRGEGFIGLTRGFMYAGSPRLVTSLWPVDDRATSELMAQFYRRVLGKQRLTVAAALREAQIEMWRQKIWRSPYYWAAFTFQGEWN